MDFIKREYKFFLVLTVLFAANILLFRYKMIDLYIDFGKEIYLAKAIAQGGVLYKDVLALFGPFAYLFNAGIVKIFGANLTNFYTAGCINAFLIITGIYALCREFLEKVVSFSIAVFVLYFCCFTPEVMNYIMPYSYAMVYGLCAAIFAAVFFVKYLKSEKSAYLYVSSFLCGLAAANKYEFILPFAIVILFLIIKRKNIFKILKSLVCFALMPALCAVILYMQGLNIKDFVNYMDIWFKFANSSDMKAYYTGTFYFSLRHFFVAIKSFLFSFLLLTIFYQTVKLTENICVCNTQKRRVIYVCFLLACFICAAKYLQVLINFVFYPAAMVLCLLLILKIKDVYKSTPVLFVSIFSLIVGLKSFFFVQINQYGRYFLPLFIIALVIVLKDFYFKNTQKVFLKTVVFFMVFMSIAGFAANWQTLKTLDTKIETRYGIVYKDAASAKIFNTMLDTVDKLTSPKDTVVVLQEGLMVNFLSGRNSDKYNYIIPSLLELYKEDNVVAHYIKTKPAMFIVLTSPEDKTFICNGWGYKICGFISQNYQLVQTIKADKLILIFKKI